MESIKELRVMLQEEKVNPEGWHRPWGYKTLQRGPSIYITRLLLPTRIRPDQITIVCILLGLVGCLFVLQFEWYWKLLGLFFLYLNIIADKVDGEVARYKKIFSLRGIYWDEINHLIIPPLFWLSLMFGTLRNFFYDLRFLLAAGALGALALAVIRVSHSLAPQIYAKKYIKYRHLFSPPTKPDETNPSIEKHQNPFRKIVGKISLLQDFLIIILLTTVILALEQIFRRDAIFHPLLIIYFFLMSGIFILFAIKNVTQKSRSAEQEIHSLASHN